MTGKGMTRTTLVEELMQSAQVLDAAHMFGHAKMLRARALHIDAIRDDLVYSSNKSVIDHHQLLTGPIPPPASPSEMKGRDR